MGGLGAIETGLTLYYHLTFVRSACTTSGCLHFMCIPLCLMWLVGGSIRSGHGVNVLGMSGV